ncbi:hypothetical protein NDU88_002689 [Pleurodeles waltl]|uniref:Uncharacterized protein n=1 Tax=Pleurodeles waltl TaxID=8319 RepID=A0AAV7KVF8_PLEWA|nr:hypothetical protein NDU88_002689 [Pleurodeles waltl]
MIQDSVSYRAQPLEPSILEIHVLVERKKKMKKEKKPPKCRCYNRYGWSCLHSRHGSPSSGRKHGHEITQQKHLREPRRSTPALYNSFKKRGPQTPDRSRKGEESLRPLAPHGRHLAS